MVRILLYVKELRSNVKGELLIPLSDTQTSRSWNYWFERIRALLASLVEELPIVIWPLVGFKKWHKDARDGKQAEAHDSENSSRDVERDERGTGREGSSAVYGQLYRPLRL